MRFGILTAALLMTVSTSFGDDLSSDFGSLELRDCFGKVHQLSELKSSKVVVIAFLGTECPLAKLYGPKLQAMSTQFAEKGVVFLGACSNQQDSLTEVVAYSNKAGISFPMLLDNEQKLADLLQAKRTPEVFVLDTNRAIQYHGRIDDQYGISVARKTPTQHELVDAIESVLKGETPAVTSAPSVGCVIGRQNHVTPRGDVTFTKHVAPILNPAGTRVRHSAGP